MNKTVIFDLDGTLLYTLEDLHSAVNLALAEYNFLPKTIEDIRNFVGSGVIKLMEQCVPSGLENPDFNNVLNEFYYQYNSSINSKTKPYDGIPELLSILKSAGIKLAVNLNKYDSAVKALCKQYFPQVEIALGARDDIKIKPDPAAVFDIMTMLGSKKADTYFAGDSSIDIETAKNAGIKSIGVTWGYRSRHSLEAAGADYIIDTPQEFLKILN